MYTDLPLFLSLLFVIGGFVALAWSSDFFVAGAASIAKTLGISPLVIGMVIIGFGTSAPELCVSVMSGISGHSNVSLGNAYGSCIFNILVILGVAALIKPLSVKFSVISIACPILLAITILSMFLVSNGVVARLDAITLLVAFAIVMPIYCFVDQKANTAGETLSADVVFSERVRKDPRYCRILRLRTTFSLVKVVVGLAVLIVSSHLLVWGSVDLARAFGVSELMIGLTIVAIGTSLPELASAIASARRGEHEFVIGNIVGSNIFNTLAVVGLASVISPIKSFSPYILSRDLPIMLGASASIAIFGFNYKKLKSGGRINRIEGFVWIFGFVLYSVLVFAQET